MVSFMIFTVSVQKILYQPMYVFLCSSLTEDGEDISAGNADVGNCACS